MAALTALKSATWSREPGFDSCGIYSACFYFLINCKTSFKFNQHSMAAEAGAFKTLGAQHATGPESQIAVSYAAALIVFAPSPA
jgi:hypothetical protein